MMHGNINMKKKNPCTCWKHELDYPNHDIRPNPSILSRPIQSKPSKTTSLKHVLVQFFNLYFGVSSDLFPSVSPSKSLITFFFSHMCCIPRPSHSPLFYHPNNFMEEYSHERSISVAVWSTA